MRCADAGGCHSGAVAEVAAVPSHRHGAASSPPAHSWPCLGGHILVISDYSRTILAMFIAKLLKG